MSSIRYTQEFKEMILEQYKTGIPISKLSSKYGPSPVTIRIWNKNSIELTENDRSDNILLKQVSELKLEIEILKKALAIFAQK